MIDKEDVVTTPIEEIIEDLMKKCFDEGIRLGLKHERVDGHETVNVTDYRNQAVQEILALIPSGNGCTKSYKEALADVRRAMGGER